MKKFYILFLVAAISWPLCAQELDSLKRIMGHEDSPAEVETQPDDSYAPVIVDENMEEVTVKFMDKDLVKVIDSGDSTLVKVGENGIIKIIDQPDSTTIRVGDKEIHIVEKDDDTNIHFERVEKDKERVANRKFRGHWAGFEWGVNNFLDNSNSISREGDDWFMDLNTGRSWAMNLNFFQYSIGFGTSHVGLLTGMGLEYNNYFFDNDITIVEDEDLVIADTLFGNVAKTKLTTTFLRIPLIFEIQFPNTTRAKRAFISAGIVAGLKLGSHTKVVYKGNDGKDKDKNNDDFNINPFRYGLTARVGFGNVCLFGDYYFTPMFVNDKGPELHPFTIGLAMNF